MKSKNKSALCFIGRVTGRKKYYIGFLMLAQMMFGASSIFYALFLKNIIDGAVAHNQGKMVSALVCFGSLLLFQVIIRAVVRHLEEYCKATFENAFKDELFNEILKRDFARVTAIHSGDWMHRLTSDTAIIADGLTTILPGFTSMSVKLIGAIVMILVIEPRFGFVLIPGGLLLLLFTCLFRKRMKVLHKNKQEKDGEVRVFLQEHLSSLMVVKTFGREAFVREQSNQKMDAHRKARLKRNHFSNLCNIGFGTIMSGAYLVGATYGAFGIYSGTISYGTLMALMELIGQIQNPLANMTGFMPKYYSMIASAERLMEIEAFDLDENVNDKVKDFAEIKMKHVSFSYDESRRILTDFSLNVEKGEFVAFTGDSGCGKSTVLKLLLGLYIPSMGEVTPVNRRLYAYVPQGNYLISDTIRGVVSFGNGDAVEDDKIKEALDVACAEFVYDLPDGLDTVLGERGLGLSEGQLQRLAIARAICSDRPVLLLDESTSALDENTEKQVLERLKNMTDRTVIIVTHRPAARSICDKEIHFEKED